MDSSRRCTRSSCVRPAVATLTYSYRDSTIVVGPLSVYREPHTYDLCSDHAAAVSAPRGWEFLRLDYSSTQQVGEEDDLLALADAVQRSADGVRDSRRRDAQSWADESDDAGPLDPADSADPGDSGASDRLPARERPAPLEPPADENAITRGHLRLLTD